MTKRKGIILAGGLGTRLHPVTLSVSKQLLPIYDKPMIYYPLTVLMMANIRQILVITNSKDLDQFQRLLGDGSQWGIKLEYKIQPRPDGLAQAFILAEEFLAGEPSAMILGDNFFFGDGLPKLLDKANAQSYGATIFSYHVSNPESYGVIDFDVNGKVNTIVEKPKFPPSNFAVTGLYFVDERAPQFAKDIKPSARGELEIMSLLDIYLKENSLIVEKMGSGYAWLDTGTHSSLLDASNFVRTLTERQGLQVGSPYSVGYQKKWITKT